MTRRETLAFYANRLMYIHGGIAIGCGVGLKVQPFVMALFCVYTMVWVWADPRIDRV